MKKLLTNHNLFQVYFYLILLLIYFDWIFNLGKKGKGIGRFSMGA